MISARRFLVVQALMLWQGGFLFYAIAVVPAGTQAIGSSAQGAVTARATDTLNLIGVLGLALTCWELALTKDPNARRTAARWWCWAFAFVCQYLLFSLHQLLDYFMDPERRHVVIVPPFYTVHRMYLWVSSVLWLSCLLLTWWTLRAWEAEPRAER
jgi:hypothetical protein